MTLADLLPEEAWKLDALCRGIDDPIAVFFPVSGQPGTLAKALCRSCDVTEQCLSLALEWPAEHDSGIWAGTNTRDRRKLRRQRRAA